jgi:hypothetical protein
MAIAVTGLVVCYRTRLKNWENIVGRTTLDGGRLQRPIALNSDKHRMPVPEYPALDVEETEFRPCGRVEGNAM